MSTWSDIGRQKLRSLKLLPENYSPRQLRGIVWWLKQHETAPANFPHAWLTSSSKNKAKTDEYGVVEKVSYGTLYKKMLPAFKEGRLDWVFDSIIAEGEFATSDSILEAHRQDIIRGLRSLISRDFLSIPMPDEVGWSDQRSKKIQWVSEWHARWERDRNVEKGRCHASDHRVWDLSAEAAISLQEYRICLHTLEEMVEQENKYRIPGVEYIEAYTARPLWWAVGDNLGSATGEPLVGQIDDKSCELHDRHGLPLARSDSLKALQEAKNQYDAASQKWADSKLVITLATAYRQAQQDMDKLRSALELMSIDDLSQGICKNCPS